MIVPRKRPLSTQGVVLYCADHIAGRLIKAKGAEFAVTAVSSSQSELSTHRFPALKGARAKQPYTIAMKDGSPFGLAALWENWRNPHTGEWERTFAIITVPSSELVGQIHDSMPATLEPQWLGLEPNPARPSEPMWPISTRVNKPENDDPSLLDRTTELSDVWAPLDWREERGCVSETTKPVKVAPRRHGT